MKTWEYKTLRIPVNMWSGKLDIEKVDEILNKMGKYVPEQQTFLQ